MSYELILQGLGVGPGSVTERWPCRKMRENLLFFIKKKFLNFFLNMSSSFAKILGETNFHTREFPRSGTMVITMAKLRMAQTSRLGHPQSLEYFSPSFAFDPLWGISRV